MAAKRAKRRQSQAPDRGVGASRSTGPRRSTAAWFLVGAISGSLVTWAGVGRDPAAEQVRSAVGHAVGHPIGIDPAKPPPLTFEFYTRLPEMEEVVVPEEELAAPQPAGNAPAGKDTSASENAPTGREAPASANAPGGGEAPASANAPGGGNAPASEDDSTDTARSANEAPKAAKPEGGPYIVQIASFRNLKDADNLKAKLILNGFNPVVQSVVLSGEEKRYRVRLGPYPDRASLEAARAQLRAGGHGNPLVLRVKRG